MAAIITINPDEPAYGQIAEYFRVQVALGKLKPDDRLPAIRELAQTLVLDPGTVARAYRELEQEGTIVTRQGKGTFISPDIKAKRVIEQRQKRLSVIIEKSILEALGIGFSVEDIETTFALHLAAWRERRLPAETKKVRLKAAGESVRFAGSHDLAVELLAVHLGTLNPGIHLTTSFIGSLPGLMALEKGEADIAGTHLYDEESGEYNISYAKKLIPNEPVFLINLMQRVQGLMIKPGNPKHLVGIRDLTRSDVTFINRQKGSGTRILLDSELKRQNIPSNRIKGYEREEITHTGVASVISRGEADAGLGAQSSASAAGLDFIPISKERYDLVFIESSLEKPDIKRIVGVIQQESFHEMLGSIPGYDLSESGKITRLNAQ
jgi:molybdate-binding protein/DNA-binding transcriptional regulator YhcF (GntR family)